MHRHAGPSGSQVDLLPLPLHLIGAQDLLGGGGEQVLEQIHHVVEIGVGLVELHGGELRIVLRVHALIAENAADLIHPVQTAHNETLQGQLGGDAHKHVDVQGVVVGDEGTGSGAAGDGVQDGGLHLHIAPAVQEVPHMLDELGADDEVALHLRVDDQVHISLAVAQLGVGQAVKFLRQGQKGLGQQGHRLHPDGHLPPLGAEHDALHSHDVADIQLLEAVVLLPIHLVPAGIELDAARLVLQVAEGHLAHAPLGHEPPGQRDLAALHGVKIRLDGGAVVGDLIFGDLEGVTPPLLELLQLVPADLEQLGQVLLLVLLFSHVVSLLSLWMAGRSALLHLQQLVLDASGGGVHHHLVSLALAQQGLAEGGVLRDGPVHGVGLLRAHDLVHHSLVEFLVQHGDRGAQADRAAVRGLLLDDHIVGQDLLDLSHAGVKLALLVLGLIVLAVLRQVSERAGLLDQLGHFLLPNCLQIIHLVLKLFQALGAEFIFLCHDSLHTFQTALRGGPGADDRSRI